MSVLLVTGGAGFIGRALCERLLGLGHTVVMLDALTYAAHRDTLLSQRERGLDFVRGDVADPGVVRRVAAEHGVEAVLHLAAESHVDRSLADPSPFLRSNVQGTWEVVEACRALGLRLVQVSSDEVYGDRSGRPAAAEGEPSTPTNPYSASKACGDHLVQAAVRAWGLDAVITRGANTYGPGQHPEKLLPLAATRWLGGEAMGVYGDGRQRRHWLYLDDHVDGILAAWQRGEAGAVLHLGGAAEENRALLGRWARALGVAGELVPVEDRPGHDREYALEDEASRAALGWEPAVGLDEGLARTAAWWRAHPGFWS